VATHSPPNGWTLIREAIEKRPELILLIEIDVGLLILADLFQFVLVLVAVAYSTWIVLPWAFYDKLEAKKANKQIGWLRRAEVSLFVSATFLVFYAITDLASGVTGLDPLVLSLLPVIKFTTLVFGFLMLLLGLYNSFRVVNFWAGAKEAEHSFAYWAVIPFLFFDFIIVLSVLIAFGIRYGSTGLSPVGWALIVSFVLAFIGAAFAVKWIAYVADLGRQLNPRGVVSVILIVLPNILFVLVYVLGRLGIL
jgi:hypothetical protein